MNDLLVSETSLDSRVRAWIASDPSVRDRDELKELLACSDCDDAAACQRASSDLAERFSGYLTFGTAGLRGQLGAGPRRMNSAVVTHATVGLARFLLARSDGSHPPVVVVGFDARHRSREFAETVAGVLGGLGVRAQLAAHELPTPVLSFAVAHVRADAGVMITASHNPRGDNGYKVYLGGVDAGRQLVAPHDQTIHQLMVNSIESTPARDVPKGPFDVLDSEVVDAYVAMTAAIVPEPIHLPNIVYTAMHGVGSATFRRTLEVAGFDPDAHLHVVPDQDAPDGDFPTLPFPNPEEVGALDLAFARAREVTADIVLAHDPDADRLGVGIPDENTHGRWRILSGNELGVALGVWTAQRARRSGVTSGALACSVVSTPQLEVVARHFQFDFVQTLPGFKWISRVPNLVYGFEEALGYLVNPTIVHDKDGISAGLTVASLLSELHAEGKTLRDFLDEIEEQFGTYISGAYALRTSQATVADVMSRIRQGSPASLAGVSVTRREDWLNESGRRPQADIVEWWFHDGSRVMFRPSGTESKLKVYLDVCEMDAPLHRRREVACARLEALTVAVRALVD